MSATVTIGRISTDTELGDIWVAVRDGALTGLVMGASLGETLKILRKLLPDALLTQEGDAADAWLAQVDAYMRGERSDFDLPIDWDVMQPFQREALKLVYAIPYGQTASYGDIAKQLGKPEAARAVGHANATNPIPLVVPCHRVVASGGKLGGYSAGDGLNTKEYLLQLEGVIQARQMKLF